MICKYLLVVAVRGDEWKKKLVFPKTSCVQMSGNYKYYTAAKKLVPWCNQYHDVYFLSFPAYDIKYSKQNCYEHT